MTPTQEQIERIETLISNCSGATEADYKPLADALTALLTSWRERGERL